MLEQVCNYVHNYFVKADSDRHFGTFEIANGAIELPFLNDGQRFRILGSSMNDGIYTYRAGQIYNDDNDSEVTLQNETFDGCIAAMSVPHILDSLIAEINEWVAANAAALNSPYMSESFGGYSYSKATGGSGAKAGGMLTWQDKFDAQLKVFRKIA